MSTARPRIALAYNSCQYVWYFRRPLIAALREQGCDVVVVAPRDEYTPRLAPLGVTYREIRLNAKGTNPVQELGTAFSFLHAYRSLRPQVALHYTVKPNVYGSLSARLLRIPVIANVTGLGAVFERSGLLNSAVRLLYRAAFAKAAKVFFQNADDREAFVTGRLVAPDRAGLLPGSGVDLSWYAPRPRADGPFTFLFVGRLLQAKGVEDLVSAARAVRTRYPAVRVVLLGERRDGQPGAADPGLLDGAAADGIITLAGVAEDVRPHIEAADCVVLPSYYREGVPRSLLEAAAMGKPLIAADSIGTREPVKEGTNGFLCRPRDPKDLAARMCDMVALSPSERRRMGEASRRIAEQRFDERIVLTAYRELVARLLTKKGRQ